VVVEVVEEEAEVIDQEVIHEVVVEVGLEAEAAAGAEAEVGVQALE